MSKRPFKAQASSSRAAFANPASAFGFGSPATSNFASSSSSLSYLNELPALSSITDAHIVVAFKNLSKRDSTTKAKALEDLQSLLSSLEHDIEDGVLEAWINIYPRTSIDNSRRVRQLAHTVQGQVALRSGKRIAKHIPKVVGAWLAGLFDNDKLVSKTASESFQQVFATPEKRQALWRAYQEPVLEYCQQVFDNETPKTLSDERSVSPDDANAKYYRVITSTLGLLASLISHVKEEDYRKHSSQYTEFLRDKKLWEKSLSEDPAVRRAVHKLLRSLLQSHHAQSALDLETLSSVYLYKGLESDQNGSALEYLSTVFELTKFNSTVWTERWTGKRSATSRLKHFVKRGSQGSTINYWASIPKLFSIIPRDALQIALSDAQDILNSLHSGITNKDEPRAYLIPGFQAYVQIADVLCAKLTDGDQMTLLKEHVLPLILQYIKPTTENSKWDIPGPRANQVLQEVIRMKADVDTALTQQWPAFSAELINNVKVSLPEQASEYRKSQDELSKKGERYAAVLSLIVAKMADPSWRRLELNGTEKPVEMVAIEVVMESLQVCKTRNGKPYGAANVAAAIIQSCKSSPMYSSMLSNLSDFVGKSLPSIYASPSFKPLAAVLYQYNEQEIYQEAWLASIRAAVNDKSDRQFPALQELLVQRRDLAQPQMEILASELAPVILGQTDQVLRNSGSWDAIVELLSRSELISKLFAMPILGAMTHALTSATSESPTALAGLQRFVTSTPTFFKSFIETSEGRQLLPNILALTESPDDKIAQSAVDLNAAVHLTTGDTSTSAGSRHGLVDVIQDGLNHAGKNSLSIDTLVSQAQNLAHGKKLHSIAVLLPSASAWSSALEPLLQHPVDKSLSIMSPLGGAVYLIHSESLDPRAKIERDSEGYSVPLRMALYTVKLLQSVPEARIGLQSDIFQSLVISLQLANGSLSVAGSTEIRSLYTPEADAEIAEFVSECQRLITNWLGDLHDWESEQDEPFNKIVKETLESLLAQSSGGSPKAYYSAQCYCIIVTELIELHGWPARKITDLESKLRDLRKSKDALQITTFLTAYRPPFTNSTVASRYCNELLADLDTLNITEKPEEGLRMLVILNSILQNPTAGETIAKQRLARYGRRFVGWLADDAMGEEMQAEVCWALSVLLPRMSDLYGDHWSNILSYIMLLWDQANELPDRIRPALIPAIHASLMLYMYIRRIVAAEETKAEDEKNDDIIEAWKEAGPGIGEGILQLVKLPRGASAENHQALRIIDENLARQIPSIPLKHLSNTDELYPQLYSQSRAIQEATFSILHREVSEKQEQVALQTILDKTTASLPDELLSLILEAPSKSDFSDESFERGIPSQLCGYLFSWMLVFDYLQHSSYKVKNDYIEGIKEGEYVSKLLDFAFDFLGHGQSRPVDVSRIDITCYKPIFLEESPRKDAEWFLTHLYYLCLTQLPSLSKTWWIECKSRPKVLSVESWTSKFISPHVISTLFDVVSNWSATQDPNPGTDEPPPLNIRLNPRAAELVASYPMEDEQSASIIINLPPTFPLHQATVTSPTKRMAIDEKHWNSWLRNAQAVIAFSNNSIIDGLLAWRKNVFGALKGQTDCAICYSVVGEDGKVPNKVCKTCKNSFHGNCLYKWFKSSNNTTCPLCRNPFNYG